MAMAVQADIREKEDCQTLVDAAIREFGRLDYIVNGATGDLEQRQFQDLVWQHFQQQLDYQLKGVIQICQAAYPHLQQSDCAAIVNIVSQVASGSPPAQMSDYVSAKFALKGLSKSLAIEWANEQIRVNTVSPGLTQTDLTQYYNERIFKMEASRTPLKRLASVADIANAVAYLLADEACFLTGVDISITGGQVMN
jgi:NAD(P)-dependent dehydrogenase (short-subunit alcohol dehydrogenase family)